MSGKGTRKKNDPEQTKCLTEGCDRIATRRGLCGSCRTTSIRMIEEQKVTEEFLIQKNLLLPKKTKKSPFAKAVQAAERSAKNDADKS